MSVEVDHAGVDGDAQETSRGWVMVCLTIAAASLGYAVQRRDGLFDPGAFWFLTISLVASFLAAMVRVRLTPGRLVHVVMVAGIGWQIAQMLTVNYPGSWHGPVADWKYRAMVGGFGLAMLGLVTAVLCGKEWLARRVFFPLTLVGFAVLGVWILRVVPHPFADAWEAQRAGLEAFCAGKSAYDAPFPDIYHYPPGYSPGTVVRNGMVELGFPYPPLTLLMDLPGHVLAGDFRYSNLLAMLGAAGFIGYMKRGATSLLAGALFLSTGRGLFILESGFTEPTVAMLLAATLFAAVRRWRVTPVLLGLVFASKQYLLIVAPCALLLIEEGRGAGILHLNWRVAIRWMVIAVAVALAVSLPIILVDPAGFVRCTITPIAKAHFRKDGLSYLALYAQRTGVVPNAIIGFVLAATTLPLALWRAARTPAYFAMSALLVLFVFFAFSKGAFSNYYYLLIGAMTAVIAAGGGERKTTRSTF